jgi:RNA polymerase sigma factor (sigma-70 family)
VDSPSLSTVSPNDDLARARLAQALARVADGDRAALEYVYRATSAKLFGIIVRILDDRGDAEDVLQEVYVSLWQKAGSFDASRASPITWLGIMARNRAIDRLRSKRARSAGPLEEAGDIADGSPRADALMESASESSRLSACLAQLAAKQSDALRSAFFGGFTYAELAQRAKVPLGTMKSGIRRALLQLRECMDR